jgi:hypothetical protein
MRQVLSAAADVSRPEGHPRSERATTGRHGGDMSLKDGTENSYNPDRRRMLAEPKTVEGAGGVRLKGGVPC